VLTTFRRATQLPATIDSILGQTHEDFELIISDDASPDETREVCREFEKRDRRIRYRRNTANLNMPGNLNAALREAKAPLVANLHDGDVYRPDLLARWKDALDRQGDSAFVFNACDVVDASGKLIATYSHDFPDRLERGGFIEYALGRFRGTHMDATRVAGPDGLPIRPELWERCVGWMSGPFGCPVWGTVMARRHLYEEANWFNPRFGFISDVDMWLRLNAEHPIAYISDPLIALAPRGSDRPHSQVNWRLEEALADTFLACADRFRASSPDDRNALKRIVRAARNRRWILFVAIALRNRDWRRARDGMATLIRSLGTS
jgi:glycosyltransferase involved in cell wall biosynthesis